MIELNQYIKQLKANIAKADTEWQVKVLQRYLNDVLELKASKGLIKK